MRSTRSQSAIFVNYVNNGNGNTEYAKLQTALQAGTGIPDVVQIEYQHLPSFIARGQLANLANYGAADAKSKFVPWTWSQVSQGSGVYGYPQDAGPMIMMCNKAVLTKFGISALPATWDEFAADAAKIHKADAKSYISNFTDDQGWYFGMLWQAGAKPFVVNGAQISINFTSPEALKVAKFWGDLLKSGSLSPVATWSNDWNSALDKSTIACWEAGAWGTSAITQGAPTTKGNWAISTLPQWTAGGKSDGAYGGSSIAVTNASQHQKAADAFARWLTTDAQGHPRPHRRQRSALPGPGCGPGRSDLDGRHGSVLQRTGAPHDHGRRHVAGRSFVRLEPLHLLRLQRLRDGSGPGPLWQDDLRGAHERPSGEERSVRQRPGHDGQVGPQQP